MWLAVSSARYQASRAGWQHSSITVGTAFCGSRLLAPPRGAMITAQPVVLGRRVKLLQVGVALRVVGVDRIEARLAKLGEATVEIVAVVFPLPHGIQPDGKQRLAVDEDHAVVAHGADARRRRRLHRDPPRLLARVAGEIAGLDEHAVQIGPNSRFRVRAVEQRIGESGFLAGDDVRVVPADPHDGRLCAWRGRQLELRLLPLRAGAAQVQPHGIAERVALAIEPADRAARTFPAPCTA